VVLLNFSRASMSSYPSRVLTKASNRARKVGLVFTAPIFFRMIPVYLIEIGFALPELCLIAQKKT
jgi:hypothetical protein